jgi:hypothetical protein
MFGTIVIKSKDVLEAREKWSSERVDYIFSLLDGKHPDLIIKDLEESGNIEDKECILFILRNRK